MLADRLNIKRRTPRHEARRTTPPGGYHPTDHSPQVLTVRDPGPPGLSASPRPRR